MKKWVMLSVACMFVALLSISWAAATTTTTSTINTENKIAQNVIEDWFATMKNDPAQAGRYLAPQFTSIHTDRIVRNKEQEIELIKNLQMKEYHLSGFAFSRSGDAIVVTYNDQGSEKIDNESIDAAPAGRMAVLQKQGKKWLILAYANLDQIG